MHPSFGDPSHSDVSVMCRALQGSRLAPGRPVHPLDPYDTRLSHVSSTPGLQDDPYTPSTHTIHVSVMCRALQDDPYTPSTHTSLESPRNGGINGYFTLEHGLLQGEPSIITSKWGFWHRKGTFITPDTHIYYTELYPRAVLLIRIGEGSSGRRRACTPTAVGLRDQAREGLSRVLIYPPRRVRSAIRRLGGGAVRLAGVHVGGDPARSVQVGDPAAHPVELSELRRCGRRSWSWRLTNTELEIDYRSWSTECHRPS
jgi:hypothetical protein